MRKIYCRAFIFIALSVLFIPENAFTKHTKVWNIAGLMDLPPLAPVITANGPTEFCAGEDVSLSFTAEAGVSYRWQRDGNDTGSNGNVYTATEPGIYVVIASDNSGNVSSNEVTVNILNRPAPQTIAISGSTQVCPGRDVTLSVPEEDGVTYGWIRNGQIVGTSNILVPTRTGVYRVEITNGCGTVPSNEVEVRFLTKIPSPPEANSQSRCGEGQITFTASGGMEGGYRWYAGETDTAAIANETGSSFTTPALSSSTSYYVAAFNGFCESERVEVEAVIFSNPIAEAGEDQTMNKGESVSLGSTGGPGLSYNWQPAEGLNDATLPNPVASPLVSTNYMLTVTSPEGCPTTDTVQVTVITSLSIPNGFSPNNDGTNDLWEIENIELYPSALITVFNRWGSIVFSSEGYANPWEGTRDGEALPMDTYFYIIDLKNGDPVFKGNVTLIR